MLELAQIARVDDDLFTGVSLSCQQASLCVCAYVVRRVCGGARAD